MIQITPHMRIYLCIAPIDFRKGIDGLSGVCRNILDKDPFSGSMFIFRNKRKTTLKILLYDGQGFWLYVKRLSSGRFNWWPNPQNEKTASINLTPAQLHLLIWNGNLLDARNARTPLTSLTTPQRTPLEKLFNSLICHHHYLGYTQPVGEHLKYLVYSNSSQRPVACFAWSSAVRHLESRDRFIGWNKEIRTKNLHLLAYNTRFLIPDWIRVRYLASHLLSRCGKIISSDWEKLYNHPVYWLETFVDTERFEGTCYKSANWLYLGKTKGPGKNAQTKKVNRSFKAVWGYPLERDFRKLLNRG